MRQAKSLAGSVASRRPKGIKIPFDDLAVGASALEQGYAVATLNLRHFQMIPDLVVRQF